MDLWWLPRKARQMVKITLVVFPSKIQVCVQGASKEREF
jgi:hypothetical protein